MLLFQNIKENLERLGDQITGIHERQPDAIRDASPTEVAQMGDALTQLNAEWDRLNRMYNQRKGYVEQLHTHRLSSIQSNFDRSFIDKGKKNLGHLRNQTKQE